MTTIKHELIKKRKKFSGEGGNVFFSGVVEAGSEDRVKRKF